MMHLSHDHKIVVEAISERFNSDKHEAVDIRASDFDDVQHYVATDFDEKHILRCSIYVPCFKEIVAQCGESYLTELYGAMMQPTPLDGYSVTLQVDLNGIPTDSEEKAALLAKLGGMKRDILGAPLWQCFRHLVSGTPISPTGCTQFILPFKPLERMYVVPLADRVVVVFSIWFKESTDAAIAKTMLQELVVARKTRAPPTAPNVSFTPEPPMELGGLDVPETGKCIGFVSIALENRHLEGERMAKAVALVTGYRTYLMYHVKCTKSEMASRMRDKSNAWLQVLNRAMPETHKEQKDIKGRVFKRS